MSSQRQTSLPVAQAFETKQSWQKKARFLSLAGMGFFADGYLNLSIGLGNSPHNPSFSLIASIQRILRSVLTKSNAVVPMIGYIYFADKKNTIPTNQSDSIKGGLSIGMIFGQVLFGFFGDAMGRHRIYGKELIITMFGTFMCIVAPRTMSHTGIVAWLVMFRIITGVGIGAGSFRPQLRPTLKTEY